VLAAIPSLPEAKIERVRSDAPCPATWRSASPRRQAPRASQAIHHPDVSRASVRQDVFPTRKLSSATDCRSTEISDARQPVGGRPTTPLYDFGRFDPAVKKSIEAAI